jgi:hypothetical protein
MMFVVLVLVALTVSGGVGLHAAESPGVFQLHPVEDGICVAAVVSVQEGQTISGLMWYNNDGDIVYPEVLVAAGYRGAPPNLADALVLLEDVRGSETGWSQVDFGLDVMSPTESVYVILRFPAFADAQGTGAGPGIGFEESARESSVFVKAEGEDWYRMITDTRLLIEPVYAGNGTLEKSAGGGSRTVLMLEQPTVETGDDGDVDAEKERVALPARTEMHAPYPNPFNPQVTVSFALREPADVKLSVFDLRGRRVRTIHAGAKPAGHHQEVWQGRDDAGRRQASGVYFIRLHAGAYEQTRRVMLLK